MRIHVDSGEELLVVESEAPITVNQVLERLGIQPSTVLAVHDGTIVPHTSLITDDLQMEIVVVSSGG
jgi:sulfur carrier protein ThiS